MKIAPFWVRVHDLPLMAHNTYVGEEIGKSMGVVEEVDLEPNEVEWGEYMWVKVKLDITKPLLRKKKFTVERAWSKCGSDLPTNDFWVFVIGVE